MVQTHMVPDPPSKSAAAGKPLSSQAEHAWSYRVRSTVGIGCELVHEMCPREYIETTGA